MDKLDRMELADIGHPRKMAQGVLKQIPDVSFPIPIEEVAIALDIVAIQDFDTTAFEGALLTNDSKSPATILVRSGVIAPRRRFTIGHELGHYLMPLHFPSAGGFECTAKDMRAQENKGVQGKDAWEAQANAFASELLMPEIEYRRRLRLAGGPSIDSLVKLSDDFGVSKLACGITMLRQSDDPIALVSAKNGQIVGVYPSKGFPTLSLEPKMSLPRRSAALRPGQGDGEIGECDSIDPCFWFKNDVRGAVLYEQPLFQADGWTLTLLTAELPDEDEGEDET